MDRKTYIGLTLFLALLFVVAYTRQNKPQGEQPAPNSEVEESLLTDDTVPLEALLSDPAFAGTPITLEDAVGEVVDTLGFTLRDSSVLILATDAAGFSDEHLAAGRQVSVEGVLGFLDPVTFEQQYGITLDEARYAPFLQQPFLAVRPGSLEMIQ